MIKRYELKLYDRAGNFKKQIDPRIISGDLTFSEQLNGGQTDMDLTIYDDIDDYVSSDIIEIRETSTENKNVVATYTGVIESMKIQETKTGMKLDITLLWLFTIFNDVLYQSWWLKTFTKNDTIEAILTDIINNFNTVYDWWFTDTQNITSSFITLDIEADTPIVNISYDKLYTIDAINKTLENTGYTRFLDQYGTLIIRSRPNQDKFTYTLDKEIVSISRELHKNEMYNKLYLTRNGGVEKIYEAVPMQTVFGIKEKIESDNTIVNEATQDIKGNGFIDKNSQEVLKFVIVMKAGIGGSSYELLRDLTDDLETYTDDLMDIGLVKRLRPWNLISTMNTKTAIIDQEILKIEKSQEHWRIYIGDFTSVGREIYKLSYK